MGRNFCCGLVASSGAARHRAYGLEVSSGFRKGYSFDEWFLADLDDVRSSFQMEVAATEFECQGLELDWVGLCWGEDFIWDQEKKAWRFRQFKGNHWHLVKKKINQEFHLNKYRVLLTRAREGMVIWVPRGSDIDKTRDASFLNSTADFLIEAGVPLI